MHGHKNLKSSKIFTGPVLDTVKEYPDNFIESGWKQAGQFNLEIKQGFSATEETFCFM